MEFNETEIKIIKRSTKYVNNWFWYRVALVLLLLTLATIAIFYDGNIAYQDGKYSFLVNILIGGTFGYLVSNWSAPKKDALLIKLLENKDTHNK